MQFFLLLLEVVRLLIQQFKSGNASIEDVRAKSKILEGARKAKEAGLTDDDILYLAGLVQADRGKKAEKKKKPTAKPPSTSDKKSGKTKNSSA